MNQGPNFLGDSFSNRDNVRATIRFRGGKQETIFPQEQNHPFPHK